MADILVINKSDAGNEDRAKMAKADYQRALHLFPPTESGWTPRVMTASSLEGIGIDTVHKAIEAYFLQTTSNGYLLHQRQLQRKEWFRSALEMQMSSLLFNNERLKQLYDTQEAEVMEGKTTPYAAAETILKNLFH